ncbi:MAG: hypothetical protein AAGN66_00160 [Acidobacteriota bacterium]
MTIFTRPVRVPTALALALAAGLLIPAVPTAGQAPRGEALGPRAAERSLWWNQQEVIDALDLGKRQRRRMDRTFDEHLNRRRALARAQMEVRRSAADALAARDWDRVEAANSELAAAAGRAEANELDMKIAVVKVLKAKQLARLVELRPRLLQRPWLPQGMRLRARARAEGPEGATDWPPLPPDSRGGG